MTVKPVNILYLSSFGDDMRGGQKSLFNLVCNLNRKAFGVYVMVPTENEGLAGRLKNQGVDVSVMEFPKLLNYRLFLKLKTFWELFKFLEKHKIEIIHTDGPRNTFYAGIVAKIKKIPLIWHVRASNLDRYDQILTRLSSKIILVADALRSRFKINDNNYNKFVTIHNGVDLSKFRPRDHNKYFRKKYNIGKNELLISVSARIEALKGQKILIEACGKLKKRIKDFHILLAGEVVDFSYLKECQDKADEFNIKNRVTFAGQLKNIDQMLNATDIFVLPSRFEAFPRSIIEAMGAGKPVIVTNVGGCIEAVENNVSGFIVSAKDSDAMANKIFLLAKDKNLRAVMGIEARRRAVELFDIQDNVKKTEKLYYEVLKIFNDCFRN